MILQIVSIYNILLGMGLVAMGLAIMVIYACFTKEEKP